MKFNLRSKDILNIRPAYFWFSMTCQTFQSMSLPNSALVQNRRVNWPKCKIIWAILNFPILSDVHGIRSNNEAFMTVEAILRFALKLSCFMSR